MRDVAGNLPLFPGIFPDYSAYRPQRARRRARTVYGALGHAVAGVRAQGPK
jgi:hypothetical protein